MSSAAIDLARKERLTLQIETTRKLCMDCLGQDLFSAVYSHAKSSAGTAPVLEEHHVMQLSGCPDKAVCIRHIQRLVQAEALFERCMLEV